MKRNRQERCIVLRCQINGSTDNVIDRIRDVVNQHGACAEVVATRSDNNMVDVTIIARVATDHRRRDINSIMRDINDRCRERLAADRFIYDPNGGRRNFTPNDVNFSVEALDHPNRDMLALSINIDGENDNTYTHAAVHAVLDGNGYQVQALNQWNDAVEGDGYVVRQRIVVRDKYATAANNDLLRIANTEGALNAIAGVRSSPICMNPAFVLLVGNNAPATAQENSDNGTVAVPGDEVRNNNFVGSDVRRNVFVSVAAGGNSTNNREYDHTKLYVESLM